VWLQRAAGNRAVAGLVGRAPLAVQRGSVRVDGKEVPGTGTESHDSLGSHLEHAPWGHLAAVINHANSAAATDWDHHEALGIAMDVGSQRAHELLEEHDGDLNAIRAALGGAEYASFRTVAELTGDLPESPSSSESDEDDGSEVDEVGPPVKRQRVEGPYDIRASALPSSPLGEESEDTGFRLMNLPDEALDAVLLQTRYEDLPNLMAAATKLWRRAAVGVGRQLSIPPDDVNLADWSALSGVVRCVARYSPNRTLHGEDPSSPPPMQVGQVLLRNIVKAVGWRNYSCTFRRRGDALVVTVHGFAHEVLEHAAISQVLREKTTYRSGYAKDPVLDGRFTDLAKRLAEHWKTLGDQVPPYPKNPAKGDKVPKDDLDIHAVKVADLTKQWPRVTPGANISVVREGNELVVYSNRELNEKQVADLRANGYRLAPDSAVGERTTKWGEPQGYKRGLYPIPFHSEMQRTEHTPPWSLTYAGNIFHACVQCMASYHALGLKHGQDGAFRGTHASKVPSIIPDAIRRTSVYLEHYLGTTVWRQLRAAVLGFIAVTSQPDASLDDLATVEEELTFLFDLLDNVERMKTDFFAQVGVSGQAKTF
jgi:hypothetical protein